MKLSTELGLAVGLLFNSAVVNAAIAAAAGCNADNCLRALFPTGTPSAVSSALAFCSTYTTTVNTATTGFPTRATNGCGTSPSRYSSACSCKPTPTPSCAPVGPAGNLVKNGGFECGLAPWTAGDVVNTAHKLSSPGAGGSATAYEFDQIGPQDPDSNGNPAFVTQDVTGLTAGAQYNLIYSVRFDFTGPCYEVGFLGSRIGGPQSSQGETFDACDRGQSAVGQYAQSTVPFQATGATTNVRFEFLIGKQGAVVRLDNVAVVPA
ncbi:mannan endo-1,4-beta-mannosidase B [Physcia stellaris]|nr:mannan endo-1,4-beta-mannosidase B [Physcia stellaris]